MVDFAGRVAGKIEGAEGGVVFGEVVAEDEPAGIVAEPGGAAMMQPVDAPLFGFVGRGGGRAGGVARFEEDGGAVKDGLAGDAEEFPFFAGGDEGARRGEIEADGGGVGGGADLQRGGGGSLRGRRLDF